MLCRYIKIAVCVSCVLHIFLWLPLPTDKISWMIYGPNYCGCPGPMAGVAVPELVVVVVVDISICPDVVDSWAQQYLYWNVFYSSGFGFWACTYLAESKNIVQPLCTLYIIIIIVFRFGLWFQLKREKVVRLTAYNLSFVYSDYIIL